MTLEVRKVSKEDYDAYWTPCVCQLLEMHIRKTKWWSDEPWMDKKLVIDVDNCITYVGVNAVHGVEHVSQYYSNDIAVVAKNGSVGLLKHKYDESFFDIYEILLLTGDFNELLDNFKKMVLKAVDKGGLQLNGYKTICYELNDIEKVTFVDRRGI